MSRPLKVAFAKPEVTWRFLIKASARGFRMSSQERFYFRWIRLSSRRIGAEGEQLLVKAARRVHRKNRNVVHARVPFLAVRRQEAQHHAAHGVGCIRLKRRASGEREAANHRDAARLEDSGLRYCCCLPAVFEPAGDANALGVVAAEADVGAVGIAEGCHHPVLRQPHWREPATGVSECPGHAQHYRADRAQSDEQSGVGRCSRFEPEWFYIRVYPRSASCLLDRLAWWCDR